MQHGGGGDGDLGRVACAHLAFQVLKICQLNVFDMAHLVNHAHHGRGQFLRAVRANDGDWNVSFYAANLLQKINVEVGATELTIGDALKTHIFLKLHNLGNRLVFNQAQLLGRDLALGELRTCIQQVFGAQKAADMVVMGGKLNAGMGHLKSPGFLIWWGSS